MTDTKNKPVERTTTRPLDDRWIAGVAAGIARRFQVEAWIVRAGFFVLTLAGGAGILLYLAGWILIPEEGASLSLAEQWLGRARNSGQWVGLGLVALAAIILISESNLIGSDLAWGIGLLVLGLLLYRGLIPAPSPPAPEALERDAGAEGDSDPDPESESAPPAVAEDAEGGAAPASAHAGEAPPARKLREKSILGRLTFGALLIAVGGMLLLDSWDAIDPSFRDYAAVSIGIVGLGLLVGTIFGRSRGLIALGFVMLPFALTASVVTASFDGGFGDPRYAPITAAQVQDSYELTGGDLWIDLRAIQPGDDPVYVEADVGFGRLLVSVPEGVGVAVTAHVGFGDIELDKSVGEFATRTQHDSGVNQRQTYSIPGEGLIELDLDVGFGAIQIKTGGSR